MQITPANSQDYPAIVALLESAKLLADDLDPQLSNFFIASSDHQIVAAGGLEIYGADALLRSLVVKPEVRGQQIGTKLYLEIIQHAQTNKIEQVFLLTETAESFFAAQGFRNIPREKAPHSIQKTQQFSDLCPASATLMAKRL